MLIPALTVTSPNAQEKTYEAGCVELRGGAIASEMLGSTVV